MKKSFILEDLECAHCGAKMEDAIGKIDGVKECNVNFIAQKLIIEAEEAHNILYRGENIGKVVLKV